ncbi:hypothetical protein EJ05DRAFT_512324 [Pseudovirgaria hyperparasitica]|uniref:Uncharacterized protein n=1 Tax=Pseudovirgaria hyperparasitica TaxID=470096 RepID=A0A6A6W558_9PEZI|nr:uncharacterized protein EJ05DRAFT_512324 [Pseudovirgaria hyperparasitica]KAF2756697.1 hypothetical protein EJ05DRAFT_512324 [Pseudovirgaria hyperparasitica]
MLDSVKVSRYRAVSPPKPMGLANQEETHYNDNISRAKTHPSEQVAPNSAANVPQVRQTILGVTLLETGVSKHLRIARPACNEYVVGSSAGSRGIHKISEGYEHLDTELAHMFESDGRSWVKEIISKTVAEGEEGRAGVVIMPKSCEDVPVLESAVTSAGELKGFTGKGTV